MNDVDLQWDLPERDDGCCDVVERDEAALELLVANEQLAESVEPAVADLDNPAPSLLLGVTPLALCLLAAIDDMPSTTTDTLCADLMASKLPFA